MKSLIFSKYCFREKFLNNLLKDRYIVNFGISVEPLESSIKVCKGSSPINSVF